MVNPATCTLYELYDAQYRASGSTAGSGAIWNLNSDALRPAGWTSADAAGLPILPGLVRYDEVQSGVITHAIRMTAEATDTSYLWPARHEAGTSSNPQLPPMGARFRLKASYDISGYSPQAQVVLRAMQQYGLILADNGSNWYFGGTADDSWPSALVNELKEVPASAFEAVDESSLMIDPNSGQARQLGVSVNCGSDPGYRLVASDGGIFSFCQTFLGSMGGQRLNAPVVGMAETPGGNGYWEVASDGGIFSYGNAVFHGSTGSLHLNKPIVGMAATPDGNGYWLVASDGGIFTYGDARFYGSTGSLSLNKPIVGMAATPDGNGYWLVASDGGIFSYGDAAFYGSRGGQPLNKPIVGMASSSVRPRLLAGRLRRRHLRLRRCRLRRFGRLHRSGQADRGDAGDRRRRRLLAGRVRRRHLQLRRRRVQRIDGWPGAPRTDRGHGMRGGLREEPRDVTDLWHVRRRRRAPDAVSRPRRRSGEWRSSDSSGTQGVLRGHDEGGRCR